MANKKRAKRDCRNYTLRDGREVVKYGMTYRRPEQRAAEMQADGLKFTTMTVDIAVSEKTARKRERESIKAYQRNHGGRKPKYNN